jgi:filamentous hemagglutinin
VSTDANKGNVTLTGSSLTAGVTNGKDNGTGAASIAATGNAIVNEGREEHDSFVQTQAKRGSFVSGSTTDTMQNTHANIGVGGTISGDTVNIKSGKDLTVQGSNVVGTNDVNLSRRAQCDDYNVAGHTNVGKLLFEARIWVSLA